MKRFGVTTVARWISEELPEGMRAYIEHQGALLELLGLAAMGERVLVRVRPFNTPTGEVLRPLRMRVGRGATVILSLEENLAGVEMIEIADDLAPAASDSWAFATPATRVKYDGSITPTPNETMYGLYCG